MFKRLLIFQKKAKFFQRFGFPFAVVMLIGVVVYLASIIGRTQEEKTSIQALIDNSEPRSVLRLPIVQAKRWPVFRGGFGDLQFRYPPNWRVLQGSDTTIIREGEDAVESIEAANAGASGESMVAYRVARISALQDLGYRVTEISKALVSGEPALVLRYSDTAGSIFYETAILKRGVFYTILLLVKANASDFDQKGIILEYTQMLATVSFHNSK